MAALLGALPLVLESGTGSELRLPLGVSVVGGLLLSQVITLYTTPSSTWRWRTCGNAPSAWCAAASRCRPSSVSISAPFILRPVGTGLLAIGLALAGILAYAWLPVAPLPRAEMPTIAIGGGLPGADPETIAASVVAPLERRLGAIAGLAEMTSYSALGAFYIVLQFDLSRAIGGAARDVQAALNAAGTDLPPLPNPPYITSSTRAAHR